jgi:hypothetical protein
MSNPIFKINNSIQYRFILPIVPFGAISAILLAIIFDYVDIKITKYLIYALALLVGVIISEVIYNTKKDEIFFYKNMLEILKGGQIINSILYEEIKSIKHSDEYTLGTGPGGIGLSYIELELNNGKFEKLFFGGYLQKKNLQTALNLLNARPLAPRLEE